MLQILIAWSWLAVCLLGVGLLAVAVIARATGRSVFGRLGLFEVLWLGFAVLVALLQLHALAAPVKYAPLWAALLALLGYVSTCKYLQRRVSRLASSVPFLALRGAALIGVAVFVSYFASMPCQNFDTFLYHQKAVKWAREFAAVPGLALLDFRLGFNNSFHLFAAFAEIPPWKDLALYLAWPFVFLLVLLQWISCIAGPSSRTVKVFCILTLPFILQNLGNRMLATLSTDLPAHFLALVLIRYLIDFPKSRLSVLPALLIVALSAVVFTIKSHGLAGYVLLTAAVCVAYRRQWKRLAAYALLPMLLTLGFVARSAMLSGWTVYPIRQLGSFSLPWSPPAAEVRGRLEDIILWARNEPTFTHGLFEASWFHAWLDRFMGTALGIQLVVATAAGVLLVAKAVARRGSNPPLTIWLALAYGAGSVVLWLFSAPDPRFVLGYLWIYFGVAMTSLLAWGNTGFIAACLVSVGLILQSGALSLHFPDPPRWTDFYEVRQFRVTPYDGNPFVPLHRPVNDAQCGSAALELLCTPDPDPRLRFRQDGDLGKGFVRATAIP